MYILYVGWKLRDSFYKYKGGGITIQMERRNVEQGEAFKHETSR
jgi:hypothetical protein